MFTFIMSLYSFILKSIATNNSIITVNIIRNMNCRKEYETWGISETLPVLKSNETSDQNCFVVITLLTTISPSS